MTRTSILRGLALGMTCLLLAPGAWANSPPPTTKPTDLNEKPTTQPDVRVRGGDANELLRPSGGRVLGPATQPSTKPTAKIADDAKQLLDDVAAAYGKLKSLRLAGAISADLDLNGMKANETGTFASTWRAAEKESIGQFRLAVREGKKKDGEDQLIVGSNGKELYVFDPAKRFYMTGDLPKKKGLVSSLGKPFGRLVENQDPALAFVLAADPKAQILDQIESVDRGDAVDIDGKKHPSLKLKQKDGGEILLIIDPNSNLLRRATADLRKSAEKSGQTDVKKFLLTYDYTTIDTKPDLASDAFAWAAPEGARNVSGSAAIAMGEDEDDDGAAPAAALEGKPAPDFKLKDMDGNEVALSDLKGKVVMLDFWATWCGPCRASMPHLDTIYKDLKDKGLAAYAVNLREENDTVKAFVDKTKLGMPVIFDTDGKVANSFGVKGIPQTVVIDKDGTIKKIVVGSGTHDAVRRAIEESLR